MAGWGDFFGKIANHVQGREERRRNKLDELSKKISDLQGKSPFTQADADLLGKYIAQYSKLLKQASNS